MKIVNCLNLRGFEKENLIHEHKLLINNIFIIKIIFYILNLITLFFLFGLYLDAGFSEYFFNILIVFILMNIFLIYLTYFYFEIKMYGNYLIINKNFSIYIYKIDEIEKVYFSIELNNKNMDILNIKINNLNFAILDTSLFLLVAYILEEKGVEVIFQGENLIKLKKEITFNLLKNRYYKNGVYII